LPTPEVNSPLREYFEALLEDNRSLFDRLIAAILQPAAHNNRALVSCVSVFCHAAIVTQFLERIEGSFLPDPRAVFEQAIKLVYDIVETNRGLGEPTFAAYEERIQQLFR
jgi:hypothetical protein